MKRILITGPDGFIGSHAVEHLLLNTDWHLVLLASWSNGGLSPRLSDSTHISAAKDRVTVVTHDLNAPIDVVTAARIGAITSVIHFAANSDVDFSIAEPANVIRNNVNCTLNLLEWARGQAELEQLIQISTDEVYGPAPKGYDSKEWDSILPSNPYSASKAAQEAICISYWRTYGVPVVIMNSMNLVGEKQAPAKFLPMIIRRVMRGESIDIHAIDGVPGSRMYLHARNYADACLWSLLRGRAPSFDACDRPAPHALIPDRWNVVGELEIANDELVLMVAECMQELGCDEAGTVHTSVVDAHSARPGHDPRYALDGAKIAAAGWKAPVAFRSSLKKAVGWYLDNREWLEI